MIDSRTPRERTGREYRHCDRCRNAVRVIAAKPASAFFTISAKQTLEVLTKFFENVKMADNRYAGMVELVDSVDLGSTGAAVQVRVLLPAPEPPSSRVRIRESLNKSSAAVRGSFPSALRYRKWEIHIVFLGFRYLGLAEKALAHSSCRFNQSFLRDNREQGIGRLLSGSFGRFVALYYLFFACGRRL